VVGVIGNGDFEDGLSSWRVVSGTAFADQPVLAGNIGAADVMIDGRPAVPLGGDFWYTSGYPLGHNGNSLIRVVTTAEGILDSDPFTISAPYLAYRLGGSAGGGSALEVRVPAETAEALRREALDEPDADGYVAVAVATPRGSDILQEDVIDLARDDVGQSLVGATAKVRLRVRVGPQRLLADHIRLVDEPPPAFRRPLWGWADIHCHPMAQAGFGGMVMAGHMHGPVEDVGSCLEIHGHEHGNPLHPVSLALEGSRHNDGSLAGTGWSVTKSPGPEEQGFRGWPSFDEVTHLKTHQDWIRRAYDGGLRLMVALIVHNQLLDAIASASKFEAAQGDRDAVEPQVQMLKEFVAHNGDWCGLATTPDIARDLIEQNKMAFVLGIETDSLNGWSNFNDLPNDLDPEHRDAVHQSVHEEIHCYFEYLHKLGVVQVNLLHLSDNAFGGMALYDHFFIVNSFVRNGRLPDTEDGYLEQPGGQPRGPGEAISMPISVPSVLYGQLESLAAKLGFTAPDLPVLPYGHGHRNNIGLMPAGEEAVLEAMRFGMVIDMDHMSEKATAQANIIATTLTPPPPYPYPLVAAHNGARMFAMTPPAQRPGPATVPGPDERRNEKTWPSESTKSETQLGYIKATGGMFGHGIAGSDSKTYRRATRLFFFQPVPNDAPGTSKTVAQGLLYVMERLDMPAGLGTDWNALLGGPGPRFGPMAVPGLIGELEPKDEWAKEFRKQRWTNAMNQTGAVAYDTNLRDWRSHRFRDNGLFEDQSYGADGRFIWQAVALRHMAQDVPDAGRERVDLTSAEVVDALQEPGLGQPALDLALGLTKGADTTGSVYFQAGAKVADATYTVKGNPDVVQHVMDLVAGINTISGLWDRMTTNAAGAKLARSTAGPIRDFDYNLDGLAHYGMLPDMLQDLKNVGLPQATLTQFFASAERYIQVWERSLAVAATIPHPKPKVPCDGGGP
jgi:microsomal dipeptidase-like Zn-dependent dipeptidase